jgi:hypothetical protein
MVRSVLFALFLAGLFVAAAYFALNGLVRGDDSPWLPYAVVILAGLGLVLHIVWLGAGRDNERDSTALAASTRGASGGDVPGRRAVLLPMLAIVFVLAALLATIVISALDL